MKLLKNVGDNRGEQGILESQQAVELADVEVDEEEVEWRSEGETICARGKRPGPRASPTRWERKR